MGQVRLLSVESTWDSFVLMPVLLLLFVAPTKADYCALLVRVESASGSPLDAPVTVLGSTGKPLASGQTRFGVARFCDVGFDKVSVVVGRTGCGQVTIMNVTTNYPEPMELKAVINECYGQEIPLGSCLALVRAKSGDGVLPHATVRTESSEGMIATHLTDDLGRLYTTIHLNKSIEATVSYLDFTTQRLQINCERRERLIERTVTLKRQ